jgi:multicomponent Na+:H+ antiporter subunit A
MALPFAIVVMACLAILAPGAARLFPRAGGVLLGVPVAGLGAILAATALSPAGEASVSFPWLPQLGMTLSFRIDGLGLLFALLVTGVGALVVVYAWSYLADEPRRGRGVATLLAFGASMLGLVLADDLLLLYVFWELTSITSWLLIAFHEERPEARFASWQALLVTAGGGLALLAGFVLLSMAAGTSRVSEILAAGPALATDPLVPWAAALALAGILTKSAQFPFHGWLPRAMEAPTPVSAYLHAATMVKAGVYLALRMAPVFGALAPFRWALMLAGGASLLVGAGRALFESDLKRVLAYSTVGALGLLLLLTGIGSAAAIHAALAYTLAHALYKGALFLAAGAVDHGAGTRDTDRLAGLWRAQPITAAAAGLAALSMAGAPPSFGYVAKEAAYGSALHAGRPAILAIAVLGSALFVVSAAIAGWLPFRPRAGRSRPEAHEVGPALWAPPIALASLGIVFGVAPASVDALLRPAAAALASGPTGELALLHGWSTAALSAGTLALGVGLVLGRPRLRAALGGAVARASADVFRALLRGLDVTARRHTMLLQGGSLRKYLGVTFAVVAALLGAGFVRTGESPVWRLGAPRAPELVLGALAVIAAVAAVRSRSRVAAITALGAVGYAIGLLFLLFGAPDLAMTQIAVETVTVMVFLLAFRHLPRFTQFSTGAAKARDVLLASAVGVLMAALVLSATWTTPPARVSEYHLERSVSDAHGRNVVNTILVDFRGLDTLGEVTVLAIAGFGIAALLKLRPRGDA